jgi:hypothetical protein
MWTLIVIGIIVVAVVVILCLRWRRAPKKKTIVMKRKTTETESSGETPVDLLKGFIIDGFAAITDGKVIVEPADIDIVTYDFPEKTDDDEMETTCDFKLKGIKAGISNFTVIGNKTLTIFKILKIRDEATYNILKSLLTPSGLGAVSLEYTE